MHPDDDTTQLIEVAAVAASVLDPAWLGIIVPVALAVGGAIGRWLTLRTQAKPHIVFHPLELIGPAENGPRPGYRYAVLFRLQNAGPGIALNVAVAFVDPSEEVFAEVVTRPALMPGEAMADFMGLRLQNQADDPSDEQARAFLERGICGCMCWDRLGKSYVFFPFGGGPAGDLAGLPWATATEMLMYLESFPSRGSAPRSLGMGRLKAPD